MRKLLPLNKPKAPGQNALCPVTEIYGLMNESLETKDIFNKTPQ